MCFFIIVIIIIIIIIITFQQPDRNRMVTEDYR